MTISHIDARQIFETKKQSPDLIPRTYPGLYGGATQPGARRVMLKTTIFKNSEPQVCVKTFHTSVSKWPVSLGGTTFSKKKGGDALGGVLMQLWCYWGALVGL